MNRRIFGALAVAGACLAGVVAASPAAAATAHQAKAATGAPIRIGVVCTCSGPVGAGQSGIKAYDDAWVKWTNANGGINGHPVKIYFVDDGGDATKSGSLVRKLISKNKIQAIAGWSSPQASSWAADARKAGIPVIGSPSQNEVEYTNASFFPAGMNQILASYSAVSAAKAYNKRRIAIFYCAEAPICGQLPGVFAGLSKLAGGGVEVTTSAKVAASSPSYAAQCLAAKNAGASSVIVVGDASTTKRILLQCSQQGWKPHFLAVGSNFGHGDTGKIGGLKLSLTTGVVGLEDTSTRGGKLLHQIIAKYAPELPKAAGYNSGISFVNASLEMFRKAATKAKLTPTSKPSVLVNGLYSLKNETLGGLIGPTTYTRGKPTFGSCWFYNTFNGKAWRNNTKPQCVTGAKLKALQAAASGGK